MKLGYSNHQLLRREREISGGSSVRWCTLLNLGTVFGDAALQCAIFALIAGVAMLFFQSVFWALAISELWFRVPVAGFFIWLGVMVFRSRALHLFNWLRHGWTDGEALADVCLSIPTMILLAWMVLTLDWLPPSAPGTP